MRTHDVRGRFAKEIGGHGTTTEYHRGCRCETCRTAWNAKSNARYYLHREKALATQRAWSAKNKEFKLHREQSRIALRLDQLNRMKLESGCVDCGYRAAAIALQFDHVRGVKKFCIAASHKYPLAAALAELAKCEVVCANCHAIRTHERRQKAAA